MAQTDIPQKTKIIMTIAALFMPVFLILPFFFWGGEDDSITIDKELQASRLAPVGQLTVGAPAPAGGAAVADAGSSDPAFDAKGEYDKICAACHGSGLMGAPKFGDTAAWQARLDKHGSLDALVKQGIQGLGSMPPKGGAGISDEQFHDVVVYLLENANIPQGGSGAAAPVAGDSSAAAPA
ncbi:MAG: c-type cytochrome, partial [Cardiobacterium hominis]